MRGNYKFKHPFVWFERGGWWFKILGECFGPYQDRIEARFNCAKLSPARDDRRLLHAGRASSLARRRMKAATVTVPHPSDALEYQVRLARRCKKAGECRLVR
jgi:hypothetical protein